MNKYTDIMLDIETFGTGTNAAIVQIGAVAFNADGDNAELFTNSPEVLLGQGVGFRVNVDLAKSKHPGVIDPSTVEWWLKQSDAARASVTSLTEMRYELGSALNEFSGWVQDVGHSMHDVRLWSNGPTFDETIIRAAFDRYGMTLPISFRGSRCCRTMNDLAMDMGWDPRAALSEAAEGIVKHDGLGDSVYQARALVSQRRFVRTGGATNVHASAD